MKRSAQTLLRDEEEEKLDELRRAQLDDDERTEKAAKRRKIKGVNFVEKWQSYVKKWDEMGLQSVSDRIVTMPVPDPVGSSHSKYRFSVLYYRVFFVLVTCRPQS